MLLEAGRSAAEPLMHARTGQVMILITDDSGEAAANRLRSKPVQPTRRQAALRSSRSAAWRRLLPLTGRVQRRYLSFRKGTGGRGATSAFVGHREGVYKGRNYILYWAGQSPLALWECERTSLS